MYKISFSLIYKLVPVTIVDDKYNIEVEKVMDDFIQKYTKDPNTDTKHCIPLVSLQCHNISINISSYIDLHGVNIVTRNEKYSSAKCEYFRKNIFNCQTSSLKSIKYNGNQFSIDVSNPIIPAPLGFFIETKCKIDNISIKGQSDSQIIRYNKDQLELSDRLLYIHTEWTENCSNENCSNDNVGSEKYDYKRSCLYWIPLNIDKWNDIHDEKDSFHDSQSIIVNMTFENPLYNHDSYSGKCHIKYRNIIRFDGHGALCYNI